MRIGFTWPLLLLGLTATTADAQRLVEWTESGGELGLGYPVPIPVDTAMPFDGFRSHAGLHARHQQLLEDSARRSCTPEPCTRANGSRRKSSPG